jgi:dolichol kinase
MTVLCIVGLVQLALFVKNRRSTDGSLALLCAGMLVGWIVTAGIWPLEAHFRATTLAAIVPLLLFYLQTLIPRRWLAGMVDFTWAYVIPYWVIVFVYPPTQLVPILPVMEKFSFFSLATTLVAAYQARSEGQPQAGFLLFTLVLLFVGLMFPPTRAWALGFFVCSQVWIVVRAGRTRP